MKTDSDLDEDSKENEITHNFMNNNSSEEKDKVEKVSHNNINTGNTNTFCNTNSPEPPSNITEVTTFERPLSPLCEKDQKVANTEDYSNGKELTGDALKTAQYNREQENELNINSNEEYPNSLSNSGAETNSFTHFEVQEDNYDTNTSDRYKTHSTDPNEAECIYSASESFTENDIEGTCEDLVPTITTQSIIKRSSSDVYQSGNSSELNTKHSEQLETILEHTNEETKISPCQKSLNHKSSTTHRVKFTEELPTKNTLLMPSSLISSTPHSKTSTMGGVSNVDPNLGEHSNSSDPNSPQVNHNADTKEKAEHLHSDTPHITIAEEFPTKEARAFGTRIDSSYEGWDNPFRPEGEISHDAEELLRLWRLGKLEEKNRKNAQSNNNNEDDSSAIGGTATPNHTNEQISTNNLDNCSGSALQQNGGHKNGVTSTGIAGSGTQASTFEVTRETIGSQQQPQQSQHVTINDGKLDNQDPKKKRMEGCCSVM